MEFIDVIKKRKSVRSFKKKEISQEKIEYICNCARLAPSWMNKQCWHFIIVKDIEKIHKLAKASIINRWLKNVPIIIIACADPLSSGEKNNIHYSTVDVAIAFEHMILAATDIGLGTCWIGGFDNEKVKNILEIPPRIQIVALTPIGYPINTENISGKGKKIIIRSTKRKSLREIIHYDIW
jgi:nitroreductase